MVPFQVVILKEHLPTCLPLEEALWLFKVGEVFVIGEDGDWVGGASKVLVPLEEGMNNGEEFPVIDVIVTLGRCKHLGEVGTQVEVTIGVFLH